MSTNTPSLATRLGIHERALAAWRAQSERNEREARERQDREQAHALRSLEQQVVDVLGAEVVLTDVRYHQDADDDWVAEGLVDGTPTQCGRYGLVMRFPCRSCDLTTVSSGDVSDLASLGRVLAAREAGERYATTCARCWSEQRAAERDARVATTPAAEPTLDQRLLALLREFVRTNRVVDAD